MGFDTDRNLGWSRVSLKVVPIPPCRFGLRFFKLAQAGVPNANLIRPQDLKTCTSSEGATDLCLIGGSSIKADSDNDNNTQTQTEIDTSNISDDSIF